MPPRLPWSELEAALPADKAIFGHTLDDLPLIKVGTPSEPYVLVLAGLHGDEPMGPNACAALLPDLRAYAASKNVGLVCYPCCNPHGYAHHRRYGAGGRTATNAAFLYRLADGSTRTAIKEGDDYAGFADRELADETRKLLIDLGRAPLPAAVVDLHQDGEVRIEGFYAYVFGPRERYRDACEDAARFLPPCTGEEVIAGERVSAGRVDERGLVSLCDGAVTDVYHRLGVPWIATVETSESAPIGPIVAVYGAWIKAAIDYAVSARSAGTASTDRP